MPQKDFNKLSERQKAILRFMHQYIESHGYPPTISQHRRGNEHYLYLCCQL
jgi:SOS-response transcriptional repressor LexA